MHSRGTIRHQRAGHWPKCSLVGRGAAENNFLKRGVAETQESILATYILPSSGLARRRHPPQPSRSSASSAMNLPSCFWLLLLQRLDHATPLQRQEICPQDCPRKGPYQSNMIAASSSPSAAAAAACLSRYALMIISRVGLFSSTRIFTNCFSFAILSINVEISFS